ncbi:MAG: hypothetical protein GVY35_04405 [Bacteroidetes bacterium]|jgi:hypothetical protein|nr:hypothetical protein [Bacteroidota bacterium]
MERAVGAEATVFDVAQRTFELDALNAGETRFAIAETLAHLDYLVVADRLRRWGAPVWYFEPVAAARSAA